MVILENNINENFQCQNLNGKCFILDPLPRDRKLFFKILHDFRHRSDQIYHVRKSPLGDPLIILPSIYRSLKFGSALQLVNGSVRGNPKELYFYSGGV